MQCGWRHCNDGGRTIAPVVGFVVGAFTATAAGASKWPIVMSR